MDCHHPYSLVGGHISTTWCDVARRYFAANTMTVLTAILTTSETSYYVSALTGIDLAARWHPGGVALSAGTRGDR